MQEEKTIADKNVFDKYVKTGDVVNNVLKQILALCVEGANVTDICDNGDNLIVSEMNKVFTGKIKRGIAFPVCICVNNCICHYSPLKSEQPLLLQAGDLVKVDFGAHVDGYIAAVAHTIVVGANKDKKVTGKKANVVLAAYDAVNAAIRTLKPGVGNNQVTQVIQKVATSYGCKPISGMLSHQLKRNKIDGEKSIIQNPSEAQRKEHEKCVFAQNEVYAVDVLVSTGEGKGKELDTRTTVYKKTGLSYQVKLKISREFLNDVEAKHRMMPFTLRSFADERKAKLGVSECVKHALIDPFNVLYEKEKELVAQFKLTILLTSKGTLQVTGLPIDLEQYQTEAKITDESLLKLLEEQLTLKEEAPAADATE